VPPRRHLSLHQGNLYPLLPGLSQNQGDQYHHLLVEVVEDHPQRHSVAAQICKGADKLVQDLREMIVDHLGAQEEQDRPVGQLPISYRNRDREESHQLGNLVVGDRADLISVPSEKRKGEDVGDKKSFNQWTLRLILLKMLQSLKEK
tara:strand:- start:1334 stop:1774 length:441 start_codon:yes stop_codon:yes gene_type:complete